VSAAVVLPLVVLAFNVRRLSALWRSFARAVQSKATTTSSAQQVNKKWQVLLRSTIYYLLLARPIEEIWFTFDLIVDLRKKHEIPAASQPESMRNGNDVRRKLTLRPWLKRTWHISAKFVRLSSLPFWLAVICIDIVLLILSAGIAYLLFQNFSVRELAQPLRDIWAEHGKEDRQLDSDKVAHAEEGTRTKQG
jgi:hypothetical protein